MSIARQFSKGGVIGGQVPKGKKTGIVDPSETVITKPDGKPIVPELMKKIAEIETKHAPAPKKGKAGFQKTKTAGERLVKSAKQAAAGEVTVAKKGRPKKGEAVSKLVPVTVMVDPDLAKVMKSTNRWQDIARLTLTRAFIPFPDIQKTNS